MKQTLKRRPKLPQSRPQMRTEAGPALSRRLEAVKTVAGRCGTFADIGSDHALLPIRMMIENLCERAIVTDLRKGPLERAAANVAKYCPKKKELFSLRRGSGLTVLEKGEAEVKTICGMGGLLIADIIEDSFEIAKEGRLVLQPNTCVPELRCYLWKKGFEIESEKGVMDAGHGYVVMNCIYTGRSRCEDPGSILAITGEFIGRDGDPEGKDCLRAVRRKYDAALEKINGEGGAKDDAGFDGKRERVEKLAEVIGGINEILGENQ